MGYGAAGNGIGKDLGFREIVPQCEPGPDFEACRQETIVEGSARPTKASDSRSKNFGFDISCEVDAIRPDVLRSLVRTSISHHIDADQIKAAQEIERQERELLQDIRSRL